MATASCHRARDIKGKSFPKEEMAEVKSLRGSVTLMSQGGSPESSRESSRGGVWGGAGAGSRAPGREVSHFLSGVRSRGGDSVRGVRKHNEAIVCLRKDRSRLAGSIWSRMGGQRGGEKCPGPGLPSRAISWTEPHGAAPRLRSKRPVG